ncbi:MAG: sigma-70 family RNA polymerase sigma factor [Acidobacteriota bacterium]
MFRRTPQQKKQEFEEIALPPADALYSVALKMTRSQKNAEDLVQDTYLRAYRFFDRFARGTNCRAWLFRILKNIFINEYRKTQKAPDLVDWAQVEEFYDPVTPDDLLKRHKNPEETLLEASMDTEVEEALAALPAEYRAVVLLNFTEDLSYKEIAEVLEIPMGTVMSRLHRGRKLLKQRLREYARGTRLVRSLAPGSGGDVVEMKRYRKSEAV